MEKYEFSPEQRRFIERMRLPFAVCQFLQKGVVTLAVSDGFCELFGYEDRAQAYSDMNQNMFKDVHPDDTARFTNAILRFGIEGDRLDVVYRTKKKGGSGYRMIRVNGEYVYVDNGARLAQIGFTDEGDCQEGSGTDLERGHDEALRKESTDNAARFDYLTGLADMSYFFELAEVGRKTMLDRGGLPALLYIDLSGMKSYNHKYGFSEGDKLLRSFARLLSQTFLTENCCHIGADRFAAFTDENGLEEKLDLMFKKWREINVGMHLPICVGIYTNRLEEVPVGMAYDRAKIACDAIRNAHTSSWNYFSSALNEGIVKQQYVLENFDRALSERWIQVYYQPIVRAVNEKVCDEEALARWIDPVKGFLSPADFIPYLEDAGLIYKLDLYVVERVLESIRAKEAEGLYIVPHSVNLSRSDFNACDMVEEIRRRVDAAGVRRDRISIEITESVIGSDFGFMKAQVERFQALGFPVWMDDFGSGYSSLDVLQSIKFNLLKFDMGFMRRLDESDDGRTILTELMKMALALGVDTICEGVETEDQVRFLQEIGCSKLQGFYYSKAIPLGEILGKNGKGLQIGYEDPVASAYYETIGRANLYDLAVIANEDDDAFQNAYSTLPIGILEIKGNQAHYVRSSRSYRDFVKHFFGFGIKGQTMDFSDATDGFEAALIKSVRQCCEGGNSAFFDGIMPDGSRVHAFVRRIGVNPITSSTAVAIAILSIREANESLLLEQILSVIEQFGEHMPGGFFIYRADAGEELLYANKAVCDIFGCDSLEEFKALTGFTFRGMVHPEDYQRISASIKARVEGHQSDFDSVEYRIVRKDGKTRWIDGYGHYYEYDVHNGLYYVFISDVTDKHEQAESDRALRSAVIEALTKSYDSVWLITDVETQRFELFRIDQEMIHLLPANVAVKLDKFSDAFAFYSRLVLEEDRQRFLGAVAPESIVRNTESSLIYSVPFRRVFDDGIRYYRVEFVKLDLPGGKTGIVTGFKNVDEVVRRDQQIQHSLDHRAAVIEALTRPYDSLWLINDMQTQQFELYRVDDKMAHLMPAHAAAKLSRFFDAFAFYSRLVLEEDRQRFLDAVTPENIRRNTEDKQIYSVPFRRVFADGIRYYRVEFAKLELDNGETNVVVGFRDVDEETRRLQSRAPGPGEGL